LSSILSIQNQLEQAISALDDLKDEVMSLPLDFAGPSSPADTGVGTPLPAFFLSGGSANGSPDASIGGAISSVMLDDGTVNNLFDIVSQSECVSGDVEYRCFYVKNTSAGTWTTPSVWISATTPSTDSVIAIGLDPAGKNGTADTPADESTAPSGVTFSAPTTKGGGLALESLGAGDYQAIWVRRTITALATEYLEDAAYISIED